MLTCQSFDVGIRHLAVCTMTLERGQGQPHGVKRRRLNLSLDAATSPVTTEVAIRKIWSWEVLDCAAAAGATEINFNKTGVNELTAISVVAWERLRDRIVPAETPYWPDVVYVEQQMAANKKMGRISAALIGWVMAQWGARARAEGRTPPRFEFVSPALKLADIEGLPRRGETTRGKRYAQSKKHSVDYTPRVLARYWPTPEGEETTRGFKAHTVTKRDDLGDAFLQGFYKARKELLRARARAAKPWHLVGAKAKLDPAARAAARAAAESGPSTDEALGLVGDGGAAATPRPCAGAGGANPRKRRRRRASR